MSEKNKKREEFLNQYTQNANLVLHIVEEEKRNKSENEKEGSFGSERSDS